MMHKILGSLWASFFFWRKKMITTKTFDQKFMKRLADSDVGTVIVEMGEWNELYEDFGEDTEYEVILNEHYDNGRWKSQHDLIFLDRSMDVYYYVRYERGLTESQYYDPFDGEKTVECKVVSITKTERVVYDISWEYLE